MDTIPQEPLILSLNYNDFFEKIQMFYVFQRKKIKQVQQVTKSSNKNFKVTIKMSKI